MYRYIVNRVLLVIPTLTGLEQLPMCAGPGRPRFYGASGRFRVSQCRPGIRLISSIAKHGHTSGPWNKLVQEFQPLCHQLAIEEIDTGQIATWPGDAGDKIKPDRVVGDYEDGGDRRGCCLGREYSGGTRCRDHGDLSANQIGRQLRQSIGLILGEAVYDC